MADGTDITTGNLGTEDVAGTESSLSNWAGDYVTDMLGRGWGLADLPYQAYEGPLTAGASPLQDQAFSGIAGLTVPGGMGDATSALGDIATDMSGMSYDPTQFTTGRFTDAGVAQQYMNPFVQQALEPELAELRRQSEISRLNDASRLTQAGAFGGSRQAIMESELNDNMMRLMAERAGKGYRDAYSEAGNMFTSDEARNLDAQRLGEQSRQFGAGFGLDALSQAARARESQGAMAGRELDASRQILADQLDAGQTQRGIESEGIAADYAQFEQERNYPYEQVQFMQSLLQGLPLEAQQTVYNDPSILAQILGGAGSGSEIYDIFSDIFGGLGGGEGGDLTGVDDVLDSIDWGSII